MKRIGIALLLSCFYLQTVLAVDIAKSRQSAPQAAPPPAEEMAPYQNQILLLAELLGSVAFLADLCPSGHDIAENGEIWRQKAKILSETEGKSETIKALIAGAYNKGYLDYEVNYHVCTDVARSRFAQDLAAINHLASALTRKYSGN